jgi:hypothetical protein
VPGHFHTLDSDYSNALDRVVAHAASGRELLNWLFVAPHCRKPRLSTRVRVRKSGVPGGISNDRTPIRDTGVPRSVRDEL